MQTTRVLEETLGRFFRPETQSSGRKLVAQEKISLGSGGDTQIQAFVRVAPPLRVSLVSESIESSRITAECSCPASRKGQFCKHIWGTLLCVEEKYPDFLIGKSDIEKAELHADPGSEAREEAAQAAKRTASERRKEHYQQQKARAKEYQKKQKANREPKESGGGASVSHYPSEVEVALSYFSENGFPMPEGPSDAVVSEAKRKLSRVFHPDKGGSHDESVQLNKHCDVIRRYLKVR